MQDDDATVITKTLIPAFSLVLLLALAGCASPAPSGGAGGGDDGADGSASAESSAVPADDAAAGTGLCDAVPSAELTAAVGTDPGPGVAGSANGLSNCTWTVDELTVIAQSADATTYFPADLYPEPEGATALTGVDSGWASAEQHTVFLVKDGEGFMLNDFLFGVEPGGQDAWTALGNAIAANL